jgi:hypothetical protein
MIGKTSTSKGFKGLLSYCLQEKKKSEILDLNGLSRNDPKGLTHEFEALTQENINISKPVWHTSLAFSHQDNMTNERVTEIANKFLEKAGFNRENNQFIIIKHNDKAHTHCHIVANRVGFDGKAVSDYYCKSRTVGWAKQLEQEYNLVKVQELAKENRRNKEANKHLDITREELKFKIDNALEKSGVKNFQDLQNELKKSGIEITILKHAKTDKEYGIKFKMYDKNYKGSDLGKNYSFKALSLNLSPILKKIKTVVQIISKGIELGF